MQATILAVMCRAHTGRDRKARQAKGPPVIPYSRRCPKSLKEDHRDRCPYHRLSRSHRSRTYCRHRIGRDPGCPIAALCAHRRGRPAFLAPPGRAVRRRDGQSVPGFGAGIPQRLGALARRRHADLAQCLDGEAWPRNDAGTELLRAGGHSGSKSLFALAIVVAVAVLREGSEIVLFSMACWPRRHDGRQYLHRRRARAAGRRGGGLFHFPRPHHHSDALSLPGHDSAYLSSSRPAWRPRRSASSTRAIWHRLDRTVWDTSWLLPDDSWVGRIADTLLGYTDQPTQLQLIVYLAVLATIFVLMRIFSPRHQPAARLATNQSLYFRDLRLIPGVSLQSVCILPISGLKSGSDRQIRPSWGREHRVPFKAPNLPLGPFRGTGSALEL